MEQEIIGLFTSMDLQNASWIGCEHICKGMYMIGACGIMENPLWLSVFWRVSRFEQFDFRFSECRENEMRKALYGYIQ